MVHVLVDIEEKKVSFLEEVYGLSSSLEIVDFMSLKDLNHNFVKITLQFLHIHLEESKLLVKAFNLILESLGQVFSSSKLGL